MRTGEGKIQTDIETDKTDRYIRHTYKHIHQHNKTNRNNINSKVR